MILNAAKVIIREKHLPAMYSEILSAHSTKQWIGMKQSFVSGYTNWRSKHVSPVGTEDVGERMRVGRNCGIHYDEDEPRNSRDEL